MVKSQEPRAKSQEPRAKSQEPRVEVYVATQRPIDFAVPSYCVKCQVDAARSGQWEGYIHDNDNPDNLSLLNPRYCELTALHTMWKTCTADIQGLYHYRRYIGNKPAIDELDEHDRNRFEAFIVTAEIVGKSITEQAIIRELEHSDMIVTSLFPPAHMRYFTVGETMKFFYLQKDMAKLWRIMRANYPDYVPSMVQVLDADKYTSCNLFIARREVVGEYCTWLFDVLGRLDAETSYDGYDSKYIRTVAYLAEVLLNVYIHKHNLRCSYFHKNLVTDMTRHNDLASRDIKRIVKNFLKGIPMVSRTVFAFRNMIRERLFRRMRELEKFLSSCRDPEEIRSYMRSFGLRREGSFLYCKLRKEKHIDLLIFVPDDEASDFLPELTGIIAKREAEGLRRKKTFLYRIILSSRTPEPLREALRESGVRIMEHQ